MSEKRVRAKPRNKHLMATGEIAARFGVTRQRVGQITAKPNFPKPYDILTVGRVWRIRDVEAWINENRPDLIKLDLTDFF